MQFSLLLCLISGNTKALLQVRFRYTGEQAGERKNASFGCKPSSLVCGLLSLEPHVCPLVSPDLPAHSSPCSGVEEGPWLPGGRVVTVINQSQSAWELCYSGFIPWWCSTKIKWLKLFNYGSYHQWGNLIMYRACINIIYVSRSCAGCQVGNGRNPTRVQVLLSLPLTLLNNQVTWSAVCLRSIIAQGTS